MGRRLTRSVVAASLVLLAGGCGSDATNDGTGGSAATGAPLTAATDTVAAPSTAPPADTTAAATTTTVAGTTTAAASPTTTIGPAEVPAGWVAAPFPATAFPPCCADNWHGTPSPALPADPAQPLADGIYRVTMAAPWTTDRPDELQIEVRRFERCALLPAGQCEEYDPFPEDHLGVDDEVLPLTVTLDATVRAGVVGWGDCEGEPLIGNGADLAALLAAFDRGYRAEIEPRLAGTTDPMSILADLNAAPAGGFGPAGDECGSDYLLVFRADEGPGLLLQTPYKWGDAPDGTYPPLTPTDIVNPTALEVAGGVLTLYFYAGFYS